MGDVLTLIEKAQANVDLKKAQEMEQKLRKAEFTLDDFLEQMDQMKNMGPLDQILGMLPGAGKIKGLKDMQLNEKDMAHTPVSYTHLDVYKRQGLVIALCRPWLIPLIGGDAASYGYIYDYMFWTMRCV